MFHFLKYGENFCWKITRNFIIIIIIRAWAEKCDR